jgi:hypothetical protein
MNPLIFAGLGLTGWMTWMGMHHEGPLVAMNVHDIQLVAEGLLEGALEIEGIVDIVECVEDSSRLVVDI